MLLIRADVDVVIRGASASSRSRRRHGRKCEARAFQSRTPQPGASMNRRLVVLAAVTLSLAACGESTVSSPVAIAPGFLRLHGDVAFDVSGAPTFKDKAIVPATFAVAILDSVSGPYILAFNEHGAGTGDFFVLGLNAARTGTFGPCADGPSTRYPDGSVLTLAGACQVRLLQDVTGSGMVFSSRTFLQSVGGTVNVASVGDRLVGTVADLHLSATASAGGSDVVIASGDFDLPLVRGKAAHALSVCFLSTAIGRECAP